MTRRLLTLAFSVLVGVAGTALLAGPARATVPAPPTGWTTTWSDDFTGAAGTGVDTSNWLYDTGPGSNFGTGEIETMSNSTSNVFQDGAGHLVIKAIHTGTNPTSGWTSGRIESQRDDFGAPAGGEVEMQSSIQQPNESTANGLGYWPAFWMLGNGMRNGGTSTARSTAVPIRVGRATRRAGSAPARTRAPAARPRTTPMRCRSTARCRRSRSGGTSTARTTSP
jgi:beta-glucanase (GH16 family)